MKLGNLEFHVLLDGHVSLDGGAMFGVIPKVMWEKKIPSDGRNRIQLAMNCLLVHAGGKRILIETGMGAKMSARLRDIYGVEGPFLNDRLKDHGLDPSEIDIVINTHLHFDHCGGNTRIVKDKVVPTFPNAQYVVQNGEFEHAKHPTERDRASYFEENYVPLASAEACACSKGSRHRAGRGIDSRARTHGEHAMREAHRRRQDCVFSR